jgi:lipoprotein signal peptidase
MEINSLLTAIVISLPVVFLVLILSSLGERPFVWKILAVLLAAGAIWRVYDRDFPSFVLFFIFMIVSGLMILYHRQCLR